MISSVILKSINIQLIKLVTCNSDQVLIGISQSMVNQQSHKSWSSIATDWQNKSNQDDENQTRKRTANRKIYHDT